jgi:polar amino acid transport system substrate-binding protein
MPRSGSLLITALSLLVSSFASAATTSMAPTSELHQALAPTGKLRVGLNLRRSFLVKRDAATGEVTGMAVELSHMLAERLNVTVELVLYSDVGPLVEGAHALERGISRFLALIQPAPTLWSSLRPTWRWTIPISCR